MENDKVDCSEEKQDVISVISEVQKITRRLAKNLGKSKKALESWDYKILNASLASASQDVKWLITNWEKTEMHVCKVMDELKDHLQSSTYQGELERAMADAGLPVQGTFPNFTLTPFKLSIDQRKAEVRLILGSKIEKNSVLYPRQAASWVEKRYKGLIDRKFNSERFCRELLAAYKYANKLIFRNDDVLWGRAVSLKTIYDILTIRSSSKKDYPRELYAYELGRLKENFEIKYKNFIFNFGFTRDQSRSILIVDSKGRESRVSTLSIFEEGDLR